MAVGDVVLLEFETVVDPDTGATVRQLSPNEGDTHGPYFTQNMMSNDGDIVLVSSSYTGTRQVHFIDLNAQEMVQASQEFGVGGHQPVLDGERRIAYYWSGRILRKVDLSTLQSEALYEIPEGFRGGILSIDNSGRYLAFVYSERVESSTTTGKIYSGMKEHFYRRPSSVVMRFDLEENQAEAVWGEQNWISHVNISPVDPDLVLFCHEGPWDRVHRMWVVRASTGECWPLVDRQKVLEKDGHEFFTASGRVVTQYAKRATVDAEWEQYNLIIRPDGTGEERYLFPSKRPGHVQTAHHDETLLVGDGAYPEGEEEQYGRSFMSLMRHTDDYRVVFKPLCKHDTSWTTQQSHPHPFFAPDDQSLFFNSDRGGRANIYQVLDLDAFRDDF